MGIFSCLFSCNNGNSYTDKHGNQITELDGLTYIKPTAYHKTGATFKIYFRNESNEIVTINDESVIKQHKEVLIEIIDKDSILFDFGAKIFFGEYGLETEDKKYQLAGIGGEYWEKYKVPKEVEYGFVIVNPGEGDK